MSRQVVIVCDVCRLPHDAIDVIQIKVRSGRLLSPQLETWDICDECLRAIRKAVREGVSKQGEPMNEP